MAAVSNVVVVMVPFPEYGHLSPLLHLSRLISSYDVPVHFASIGARIKELKLRQQGAENQLKNIVFHDLEKKEGKEGDDDYMSYFASLQLLDEPLSAICRTLSTNCRRVVVIYDSTMLSVVQGVYKLANVETYIFHAISAFTVHSLFHQVTENNDSANGDGLLLPFQAHIPPIETCYPPVMKDFVKMLRDFKLKSGGIFNTCGEIEGPYLDALAKQSGKPVWGLGPFNPVHVSVRSHRCIEWLDKQPLNSVIYVSFGTATALSPEQINELALGLERSEQKFIWVLRDVDKKGNDLTTTGEEVPKIDQLPIGFEERVAERGIIARDWVPQLEILGHPSTGGYLFHSGWNSFLESLTMGVPVATWPLRSDNPFNDVLITKVLKVGIVVRDWAYKDELVKSDTIANGVRTLMASPQGEEMRQRTVELSRAIKMSLGDGGATRKQIQSFIAHINR